MAEERWKEIPGCPGYEVSDHGRVRSVDRTVLTKNGQARFYRGAMLVFFANQFGHLKVTVRSTDRSPAWFYVHDLVSAAFVGPKPAGQQVRHDDGNHLRNHFSNLLYGTQLENSADMKRHGTVVKGEAHPKAVLTAAQVVEIKAQLGRVTQKNLAARYGVTRTAISAISIGRSWR